MHAPSGTARCTEAASKTTPASVQAAARAPARGSASTMWANGSPTAAGSASRPKVRKTGRTGSERRLSLITISVIGSVDPAIRSQIPSCPSMRRPPAARA